MGAFLWLEAAQSATLQLRKAVRLFRMAAQCAVARQDAGYAAFERRSVAANLLPERPVVGKASLAGNIVSAGHALIEIAALQIGHHTYSDDTLVQGNAGRSPILGCEHDVVAVRRKFVVFHIFPAFPNAKFTFLGGQRQRNFIELFGASLRMRNPHELHGLHALHDKSGKATESRIPARLIRKIYKRTRPMLQAPPFIPAEYGG